MQKKTTRRDQLAAKCLRAFIKAGTLDLSLDELADTVGASKRMLVHYFGGREGVEEQAMTLLEENLRAQFAPPNLPAATGADALLSALWERTTSPGNKGVLLLVMDVSRRAWNGSSRARSFYGEQQRLWSELLMGYMPDRDAVEDILQSFQGAVLAYLITGDPKPGRRMLSALGKKTTVRSKPRV